MSPKAAKQHRSPSSRLPQLLAIAGVLLLAILILLTKQEAEVAPVTAELPEDQLMHALDTGQPTLAFFHSLTCDSCKQMTAIVGQVYPEFAGSIALVDVDVYDQRNAQLLQSAGIRAIPTVILFDRSGHGTVHMGVVEAEDLRGLLAELREGS